MVHEIGLRSTRIRSLERTLVTIPNAEFSQMNLENFAVRDTRLLTDHACTSAYDTTMDQLRHVLAELRKLLHRPPHGHSNRRRACTPRRFRGLLAGRRAFRLPALPGSRHVYLAVAGGHPDSGSPSTVRQSGTGLCVPDPDASAQAATRGWMHERATGRGDARTSMAAERGALPFPELAEAERTDLEDGLDYPPEGSPGHEAVETSSWPRRRDPSATSARPAMAARSRRYWTPASALRCASRASPTVGSPGGPQSKAVRPRPRTHCRRGRSRHGVSDRLLDRVWRRQGLATFDLG